MLLVAAPVSVAALVVVAMAVKVEILRILQALVAAVTEAMVGILSRRPVLGAAAEAEDFLVTVGMVLMAAAEAEDFSLKVEWGKDMTEALLVEAAAEVRRRTAMRAKAVLVHVLSSTRRRRPDL